LALDQGLEAQQPLHKPQLRHRADSETDRQEQHNHDGRFFPPAPSAALLSGQLNFVKSAARFTLQRRTKTVTSISVRSCFARQLLLLLEVPERAGEAAAGNDGSRRAGLCGCVAV